MGFVSILEDIGKIAESASFAPDPVGEVYGRQYYSEEAIDERNKTKSRTRKLPKSARKKNTKIEISPERQIEISLGKIDDIRTKKTALLKQRDKLDSEITALNEIIFTEKIKIKQLKESADDSKLRPS